ncbi:DUF2059 domain-containing protein [Sphingomonas piscis]|uniref:DUF2059 domain-containing protein n=1 Tax=Sphingomonas piscis TaxID=2714943 RepID=A0A6G7YRX2_9SPHN|nr:DUF2059 domain-containing protein [Sphingomonas piscis]QIK79482.1 DUF2059 domain-containing protein [Sphingomonas piscis]
MPLHVMLALAATTAAPTQDAAAKPKVETSASAKADKKPDMDPMKAMALMMNVFDKFFPAGPEPDPARLAVARQATMTMFPKGTYAQAVNGFVDTMTDRVLNMSEADFAGMFPEEFAKKAGKDKKAGPPSTEPLRVMLAKKEPNFDAKLAAIRAFAGVMFVKLGDVAEPKFREGMARALARKFDDRQLAEIQTFLATPTGAAYSRQMVGLWFEPEVMRGSLQLMPDMMTMFPDLMKDGAAFDAQMKALDKPAAGTKKD